MEEQLLEQLARVNDLGTAVYFYQGTYSFQFIDLNNDSIINEGCSDTLLGAIENAISAVRRSNDATPS